MQETLLRNTYCSWLSSKTIVNKLKLRASLEPNLEPLKLKNLNAETQTLDLHFNISIDLVKSCSEVILKFDKRPGTLFLGIELGIPLFGAFGSVFRFDIFSLFLYLISLVSFLVWNKYRLKKTLQQSWKKAEKVGWSGINSPSGQ